MSNDINQNEEVSRFTLTDEEGNELEFELIGSGEVDGVMYYAMIPAEDAEDDTKDSFEYVILKSEVDENGEESCPRSPANRRGSTLPCEGVGQARKGFPLRYQRHLPL
ncbi:MAG: DUF1292 domain-containing protein [Clostridia bacterium]|nr:DUF1292 domain-containing protein [Clostridia bacterium]